MFASFYVYYFESMNCFSNLFNSIPSLSFNYSTFTPLMHLSFFSRANPRTHKWGERVVKKEQKLLSPNEIETKGLQDTQFEN